MMHFIVDSFPARGLMEGAKTMSLPMGDVRPRKLGRIQGTLQSQEGQIVAQHVRPDPAKLRGLGSSEMNSQGRLSLRVARYRLMARSSSPAIGCSTESEFFRRATHSRQIVKSKSKGG